MYLLGSGPLCVLRSAAEAFEGDVYLWSVLLMWTLRLLRAHAAILPVRTVQHANEAAHEKRKDTDNFLVTVCP
jgi:hypothetical protein